MYDILYNYVTDNIYKTYDDQFTYHKCIGCLSDAAYKTSVLSEWIPYNRSGGPPYRQDNIRICQLLYNDIILA
jgi:hypothetical protein